MIRRTGLFVVIARYYSRCTYTARRPRVSTSAKPNRSSTTRGSRTRCVGANDLHRLCMLVWEYPRIFHYYAILHPLVDISMVFFSFYLYYNVRADIDPTISIISKYHRLILLHEGEQNVLVCYKKENASCFVTGCDLKELLTVMQSSSQPTLCTSQPVPDLSRSTQCLHILISTLYESNWA